MSAPLPCPFCCRDLSDVGDRDSGRCRYCQACLPERFGTLRSRILAVTGTSGSGKSVLLTVLFHELKHRLGQRLQAAVASADETTLTRFGRDYEDRLYSWPRPDPDPPPPERQALAFRITVASHLAPGSSRARHLLLSAFELAGLDDDSGGGPEPTRTACLKAADAVLVLLDPLNPGPADAVLADVLGQLKRPARLAIVVTKLDELYHELAPGSPLRRPSPLSDRFDETDSAEVQAAILELLSRRRGGDLDLMIAASRRQCRYFGLSALGGRPAAGQAAPAAGVLPYRVGDPLAWLLAEFGLVKRKRG